jgi:hypothetical protein
VILACAVISGVVLLLLSRTRTESASTARPLWSSPGDAPVAQSSDARSSSDALLESRSAEPAEHRDPVASAEATTATEPRMRWLLRGTIANASRAFCAGGEAILHPDVRVTWQTLPNVRAPIGADGKFVADLDLLVYGREGTGPYAKGPILLTLECPAGMQVQRRFLIEEARPCTLEDGSAARCIDMLFDVEAAAVLTGKVVDELGKGIPRAAVAVLQAPETLKPFAEVARMRTDQSGEFRLLLRPCGPCLVVAATNDREPAAKRLSVDVISEQTVGRLVLQPGVTISGRVTDKVPFEMSVFASVERTSAARRVFFDGAPWSGLAFTGDVPVVGGQRAKCSADGAFEIKGLSRTSYCLSVVAAERGQGAAFGYPEPCFQAPAAGILLGTNGARVVFEVSHGGKPLANANLRFPEYPQASAVSTNHEGSVDYILPPEKDVAVRVEHPPLDPRSLTVRTPRAGDVLVVKVELTGVERTSSLSLSIVHGDPAVPLSYATVRLLRAKESGEDEEISSLTSPPVEGRWLLEKLPAGIATVVVEPNGTWNRMRGMMSAESFEIDLVAGQVTERTVTIRPGGLIRVDARDSAGAPARARITLRNGAGRRVPVHAMVDDGSQETMLYTDTPGATPFLLVPAVPEGDYELELSPIVHAPKPVTRRIHVTAGTIVDESIEVP